MAPDQSPGPQDYQRGGPTLGTDAPAFTIYPRIEPKQSAGADGPAPGDYDLPVAWRTGPAVTLGSRPQAKPDLEPSPGPGQYYRPADGALRGGAPAFSFGGRPVDAVEELPGPGEYFRCVGGSAVGGRRTRVLP